jgi:hypothetical protein
LRVWGFFLGFLYTQSCCAKIEHQQNNPCTLLLTLLHYFLHRENNGQTGKKEASGSVVPLPQQEAHMLWKNLYLMEKEQTNQSLSGCNQKFWV